MLSAGTAPAPPLLGQRLPQPGGLPWQHVGGVEPDRALVALGQWSLTISGLTAELLAPLSEPCAVPDSY